MTARDKVHKVRGVSLTKRRRRRFQHGARCLSSLGAAILASGSLAAQDAKEGARYLYLQNCGAVAITHIDVQVKKFAGSDWMNSGHAWSAPPLLGSEAACFDTADMYGDVPNEERVRLKLKFEDGSKANCDMTRVDKSHDGDLRLFSVAQHALEGDRCHAVAVIDWQPQNRCNGNGERFTNVQCN